MSNNNLHRSLASGLFWVVLANLVVKPFWILGIDRGVQNAVGATEYGLYFVVFNLAYIFNILLDLGVTNFNTRNIAQHPQLIQKHLSGILSIKFLLLGLYLLVTLTAGLLLGYEGRQFRLLLWLCANQFLNSLITYLRSNFEGLLLFRWDSLLSVMDRLMMIVICGFLLWGRGGGVFRIEWFVYAQTAAYLLTLALAFIVLARRTGLRRLHFSRPFTWAILKQSAPFALLVLLMASYNRLDPVLLQRLLPDGAAQAGIYAGAFRLLDALTMVAYLVSVPLLPIYARLTKHTDTREIATITGRLFALMMVFALTAAVVLSLWAYPWMGLMYEQHVFDSAAVFRILVWGIVPISTTYIFGTLLTANGSLRQLN
ncbi:MAG: oligosaccharide flippase family protein, partial [Bacteroidales bacterium]|nr:oligosaccharide flippase family protein [Bacteroidales bacterium]